MAGAPFCEILRELFFVNLAGTYFSLKRGAWSIKKGAEASLWGKKGVPTKCTIPKRPDRVFLWYWLVKYRENTNRYRTKIPNWDATLENTYKGKIPTKLFKAQKLEMPARFKWFWRGKKIWNCWQKQKKNYSSHPITSPKWKKKCCIQWHHQLNVS